MIKFIFPEEAVIGPIELIPDFKICRIEGRNGVGKSLAIRLLELGTGSQPYASPVMFNAWDTLREQLGQFQAEITIEPNLLVNWSSDSARWPPGAPLPTDDWIGNYEINGKVSNLAEVTKLIRVKRIVGDETLAEAISDPVRKDRAAFAVFSHVFAQSVDHLIEAFGRLEDRLERLNPEISRRLREQVKSETETLEGLVRSLQSTQTKREQLESATLIADRLRRAERDLPDLEAAISKTKALASEIELRRDTVEQELNDLRGALSKNQKILSEVGTKRQNMRKAEERLAASEAEIQKQLSGLDQSIGPEQIDSLLQRLSLRSTELLDEKKRIYKIPQLKVLVRELLSAIDSHSPDELGEASLLPTEPREKTVGETHDLLLSKDLELRQTAPPSRVAQIDSELIQIGRRKMAMDDLRSSYNVASTSGSALKRLRGEVSALEAQLSSATTEKDYKELSDTAERLSAERTRALVELARLESQHEMLLRSGDRSDMQDEIASYESTLGPIGDWEPTLAKVTAEIAVLAHTIQLKEADLKESKQQQSAASTAFLAEVHLTRRDMPWILRMLDLEDVSEAEDDSATFQKVEGVKRDINQILRDLDLVRNAAIGALGSLDEIISDIESRSISRSRLESPYSSRIRDIYINALAKEFDNPKIRAILFQGGVFKEFDIERRSIVWVTPDGAERRRPLEAFSSGEYAYAYTLARLESLNLEGAKLRIIALDEFGAYLERERLDQLMRFLDERVLGEIADQIIVILPLTRDYEEIAEISSGTLQQEAAANAEDVRNRGYVALDQRALLEGLPAR